MSFCMLRPRLKHIYRINASQLSCSSASTFSFRSTTKTSQSHSSHQTFTMQFQSALLALFAGIAVTNAAVIQFYSDDNCQTTTFKQNIYDTTICASTGGFKSYKITTAGGTGENIETYSTNACATSTSSTSASEVGVCVVATNSNGGSNSVSSL